jgi:hypothetical protein
MEAFSVGPRLLQIIHNFWAAQQLALRQAGYYGRIISPGSGVTQGGLDSGDHFNICADAVICTWEAKTIDHTVHGNRTIGEILSLLYADDDQFSAMDREWLQQALNILIDLFARAGLKVNIAKTKFMICLPNSHHSHMSEDAYKRRMTGEGETYRKRKRRRVECPECSKQLAASNLPAHLRNVHKICGPILDHGPSPLDEPAADYRMSGPKVLKLHKCPVPN